MLTIRDVRGREVLDSRGNPTVEVEVVTAGGARGRAIVPSGASTGRHEAVELRDGDSRRHAGRGVLTAVMHVRETLGPALAGMDATAQADIDRRLIDLDGTPNKSRLGANAILGVSLACAHAAARARGVPLYEHLATLRNSLDPACTPRSPLTTHRQPLTLPSPMVNMISGGLHAGGNLDFQDFLVMLTGASSFREALEWAVAVYRSLGRLLAARGHEAALVGDEGGYGPRLARDEDAVAIIVEAIEAAGLEPGRDAAIAIDVASTHFYQAGRYRTAATGGDPSSAEQLIETLDRWCRDYPIVSIEDACAEDDWDGWRLLTDRLGGRVQLVGDDLFVTNPARLALGIERRVANAVLVKPNQVGTLTETLEVIAQAKSAGYATIVSARSGETEDTTIAHLAVATAAGQIKIGSVARSERLAKYNELLRIEEQLGARGSLAAWHRAAPQG